MDNTNILKEMGNRIKKRRIELGITQEQLAEKMDVSIQMISNLELGKKAIRPENLVKVCDALNTDADYLLRGKHAEIINAEVFEKYLKLPEDIKKSIEMLINSLYNI